MPKTSTVKQMYLSLENLHNAGHHTWVTGVKNILDKSELAHFWNNELSNNEIVKKGLCKHMQLLYKNLWLREMQDTDNNPKLRLYRELKDTFETELYPCINVEKHKLALSSFKLSSHHLGFEVGRLACPPMPVNDRVCTLYNSRVDDKIHFLTECTKYERYRNDML